MNIIVCIRFCPDVAQLRADPQTGAPRFDTAPLRISTLDEHAVEQAVRLRERCGGKLIAVSLVDGEPPRELELKVLAMGVDQILLLIDGSARAADALATATILAAALTEVPGDLILFGEGSIDRFDQQVGPRVAEALDLPAVTYVSKLEVEGDRMVAERILEDRIETVRCRLPAVVTIGHESTSPRLPSVLQVLGASRKPRVLKPVSELSALRGSCAESLRQTETLRVVAPAKIRRRIKLEGADPDEAAARLVRSLRADGALDP